MIKSILQRLTRKMGLDIRRYTPLTSERAKLSYLLKNYEIDLVLDIGANEGQYVRLLRELNYQGKAISFEPLSSAYKILQNVSQKDAQWELAPRAALGNYEGEIMLNIASNQQSSSVLPMLDSHRQSAPNSRYIHAEKVNVYPLDTIPLSTDLNNYHSIFAKIDVQGWEKQVIEGATSLLPKIKGMQVELSLIPLYEGQILYQEIINWLQDLGYELYSISPTFTNPKTLKLLQVDGIFFKP